MTKQEFQKMERDRMFVANHKIFMNVANYLMGTKWVNQSDSVSNGGYQIDSMSKNSRDDIIRVKKSYFGGSLMIYFSRNIRICSGVRIVDWEKETPLYYYFGTKEAKDFVAIPENEIDEYIKITTEFLKELCRHASCLREIPIAYSRYFDSSESKSCVLIDKDIADEMPEGLNDEIKTFEGVLLHEYTYDEKNVVEYMTKLMKSKKFRHIRDDV